MNVIIYDNDKQFINELRETIILTNKRHEKSVNIKLVTTSREKIISEAENYLNYNLDSTPRIYVINPSVLKEEDGINLAKELREMNPLVYIVFASKNDYIRKTYGYDIKSFAYFFKPIGQGEWYNLITDIQNDFDKISGNFLRKKSEIITLVSYYKKINLHVGNIIAIESRKPKILIHTTSGTIASYLSIKDIEEKIDKVTDDSSLLRVHSGFAVNINKATSLDLKNNLITTIEGKSYPIARTRKKEIVRQFNDKATCCAI